MIWLRLYKALLHLYPARFREDYGFQLEQQLRAEYSQSHNSANSWQLPLQTAYDLLRTIPVQWFEECRNDCKLAWRSYQSRRFVFTLAVLALALAIGTASGIFSVLNSLLLRGLPFEDPETLVELWNSPFSAMAGRNAFADRAKTTAYLEDTAAFCVAEANFSRHSQSFRITETETSANFFSLLGTRLYVGRNFTSDEDLPGHNAVAIIGYNLWQQFYAGSVSAIGTNIRLNGSRFTVIGVAPPSFDYPGAHTSVWVPTVFDIQTIPKHGAFQFRTIGRLRKNMNLARAALLFLADMRHSTPGWNVNDALPDRPALRSLRDQLAGPVRQASATLAAMALLLVLAACANVAHLLLAHAGSKQSDLAVRAALGASAARLSQQQIIEATLLTSIAAFAGLGVASFVVAVARSYLPPTLSSQDYAVLDWRVFVFAVVLAVVTGIALGALPASLNRRSLRFGFNAGSKSPSVRRFHQSLIIFQTALALLLLFVAVALGDAFRHLSRTDLGFQTPNVVTASVSLAGIPSWTPVSEWQYDVEVLNRLRSLDGVRAVGAVGHVPLGDEAYMAFDFKLEEGGADVPMVVVNASMPGYFDAIGTQLLAGRDFKIAEQLDRERPVIVNEEYARRSGLGSRVLGRHLKAPWSTRPYVVVGIVQNQKFTGPQVAVSSPEIFWPTAEEPAQALTFVARLDSRNPELYLPRLRDTIRAVDNRVALYDVKTLDQRLTETLGRPCFYTTATLFLALLATLGAAAGIYGIALYTLIQRRREIGVRMALGASNSVLRWALFRESLIPICLGLGCGLPAGFCFFARCKASLAGGTGGNDGSSDSDGARSFAGSWMYSRLASWCSAPFLRSIQCYSV